MILISINNEIKILSIQIHSGILPNFTQLTQCNRSITITEDTQNNEINITCIKT